VGSPLSSPGKQLRALILVRLIAVTCIALPRYWLGTSSEIGTQSPSSGFLFNLARQIYGETQTWQVTLLLVSVYLLSLLYAVLLLKLPHRLTLQALTQTSVDLLLVSAMVLIFGGIYSPLSLLYPMVLVVAAFHGKGRLPATTFATAALVLYTGVMLGELYSWRLPVRGQDLDVGDLSRTLYNVAVALVGFYGTTFLGSALARRTEMAEAALAVERGELADLRIIYQDIIQSINSGLITTDLRGKITSVNRAGEVILKIPASQLLYQPIQHCGLYTEESWRLASEQSGQRERYRDEVRLEQDSGVVHVGCSVSHLQEANGDNSGYIVIFQDLTDYRQLQHELQMKDRMAAVGELAAGLAHEIGNPLAAISGSAQMLAGKFQDDAEKSGLLGIILKESRRLDRTIKGFLQFARPMERSPHRFDLAAQLKENFALLRNSEEVSPKHTLRLDLKPDTAMVTADPDQMSQIFWNLVRNALRAMPDGGTLTVRGQPLSNGSYAMHIIDTGHGIPEEELQGLFHPFRSFFDGGVGIGMAIVYRIVQEHGGTVRVDSMTGEGTDICVELPNRLPPPKPRERQGDTP